MADDAGVETDIDAAIVADRVRGLSDLQVAEKHGVTVKQVTEALDRAAARDLSPENVQASLIRDIAMLMTLERVFTAKSGKQARNLVAQAKRQRERTGRLILDRLERGGWPA